MNTRQQRYFLLGIILLSFFLSGQFGGKACKEDCFGIEDDEERSIHSLADEYYDIHVRIKDDDGCGGTVTPMEARVAEKTGAGRFTVTPGGCKSMNVYVGGGQLRHDLYHQALWWALRSLLGPPPVLICPQ